MERKGIFVRRERFETKDLDKGAGLFFEVQPRLYHPGVVEHQQAVGRQCFGQLVEPTFFDGTLSVNQQFGVVALRKRKFGDTLVG